MIRRDFLACMGAAAAWPSVAAGQSRIPKIAILLLGTPDPTIFIREFQDGLRELGYVDGRTISIEIRNLGGVSDGLSAAAAELVAMKPDILVGFQTPTVVALRRATQDIPIVMGTAGDPVGTGLVASLARPGGNVTGMSGATAELGAKSLELIREMLPSVRRVAVLANAPDPFSKPFLDHIQTAAKALDTELRLAMINAFDELDMQLAGVVAWGGQAVIVQPSLPHQLVAELALKHRLPATCPSSGFPAVGGLMSYSADFMKVFRQGAMFVDKILKGRKPADLPVEQPTQFHLAINLKVAKALGITVPGTMLTRADQVIE